MFKWFQLCMLLLAISTTALATSSISNQWQKHKNTACTEPTIEGWHTHGTSILQTDSDGTGTQDVACESLVLVKSGTTNGTWTYTGGNDVITTDTQLDAALAHTPDCSVVTSITINGTTFSGICDQGLTGKPILISASKVLSKTLTHELGHRCGLTDLVPSVEKRIMNQVSDGSEDRVTCEEANAYYAGATG